MASPSRALFDELDDEDDENDEVEATLYSSLAKVPEVAEASADDEDGEEGGEGEDDDTWGSSPTMSSGVEDVNAGSQSIKEGGSDDLLFFG